MSRVPKALLPTGDKPLTAADLAPLLKYLEDHPLLSSAVITATVDGTTNLQRVNHPLGRHYRGVFAVGINSADTSSAGQVKWLDARTAAAAGIDTKKQIGFRQTSATSATTYTLVVF